MKWSLLKNSGRGAKKATGMSKKKWLLLTMAMSLFIVSTVSLLVPKTSSASAGYNDLYLVYEHCHDLHDITYDFNIGADGRCHDGNGGQGWQEALNSSLGCSDSMFYQHNFPDPHDPSSITKTLWYTKEADYKDCWEKAQAMYNAMSDPKGDCAITKDGSDNNKKCVGYQNALNTALGCDSSMFQSASGNGTPNSSGDYWVIKPGASNDCQDRVNHVGNVHMYIIGADGKVIQDSNPIKSDKVTDLKGAAAAASSGSTLACDASSNPLSWILCPVINDVLVPAISLTDSIITQQLVVPANQIFCGSSDPNCAAYYSAWASFRNISLGLLTIVGLVVVIAQAIGMEILDAYTIRKMLPRILIAAIAITLSWTLMNFAVTLSNNLGFGIRALIIAPFHSLSSTINFNFISGSDTGSTALNFLLGGAAGVAAIPIWIAAGGIGVLLSYVATAGLAVLVAVLVLILRQIAVTLLILVSPIALIAYVMPNTQRIFRLWWESFSRALLMFPLISAFIGAGRVFAAISLSGASASGSGIGPVVHDLAGFIAYFGPYFAIPLTFGMSGAMMGGIGNMINQRAQGAQGLLGNYRKSQAQSRVQRARAKGLYREGFGKYKLRPGGKQRSVGHGLNTLGFWGVNADEMIPMKLGTTKTGKLIDGKEGIPGFRRGGQALHSRIKRADRDQTVKGVQDLDIGYKSGRLMAGQNQYFYKALGDPNDPSKLTDAQKELNENFAMRDSSGAIMYKNDEDGNAIPVGWNAPDNWGERNKVADIMGSAKGDRGIEAREAAGELRGTASEFEKYTGSAETNRVDGRLLGLLSAAKAGRLEMEDVATNYNNLNNAGDQESAIRETTLLQDALTQKRVSAARGHGMWWDEKGKAHSSYENPLSSKAATSLMRINNQEIAGSKSEDLDALRETIVAHGSPYKMVMGKDGKVKFDVRNGGKKVLKDDPVAVERAQQVQSRLKTLAQYNYGDSDVGVKVKEIWERLGNKPDDLTWGKGGSTDERVARDMAEQAQQQDGQEQQAQQQGGQGGQGG